MAWREIRVAEAHNKLVFRYEDELDIVEVFVNGKPFPILLDDYRPIHRRRACAIMGIDFRHIEGEERTG